MRFFVALLRILADLKMLFGLDAANAPKFYTGHQVFTFAAKTGSVFLPKLCANMVSPRQGLEYNKTVPHRASKGPPDGPGRAARRAG